MGSCVRGPLWTVVMSVPLAATIIHSFPLELDVTEPSVAVEYGNGHNLTARDSVISKRAIAPASDFNTWWSYRCRGEVLETYMLNSQAELPAPITQAGGFTKRSWSNDYTDSLAATPLLDMSSHQPDFHLAGLHGVDSFLTRTSGDWQSTVTYDNDIAPWLELDWRQDKKYYPNGDQQQRQMPATKAEYYNVVSIKNKAIVVRYARSPHFMSAQLNDGVPLPLDQLPKVQKWSDAIFLQIASVYRSSFVLSEGGGVKIAPPLWYLIEQVSGPPVTLEIISHCLTLFGWQDFNNLPTFDQKFTFPIGSACYRSILGTPNSAAIAWFLIQHKFRFLDVAMGSVTIWGSGVRDPATGYEYPTLLWWAGRANWRESQGAWATDLKDVRDDNAEFEGGLPNGVGTSMAFPRPMKPVYA